jgi:hypothetical protein
MTSKLSRMRYGEQTLADFEIFQGLPMGAVQIYSKRCIWKHFENHQILIEHISTLSVQNRVRTELLRLAQISSPGQNTAIIFPAPAHADIANRISTHRKAVTREFGDLSRAALLERRNSSLIIKDVKKLSTMASDMLGE